MVQPVNSLLNKPLLSLSLVIDSVSFLASFILAVLLFTKVTEKFSTNVDHNLPLYMEDKLNQFCMVSLVGAIVLTIFCLGSLVCLLFSLCLLLPEWSLPAACINVKRLAITEYLQTICPPECI
ncbi:uncharacterized protein LOC111702043 isoform X2 [Eurytemora carolleeae]|uniref:uncharacterized protein LOC111702043 isoform X2 n=1 Tax=Eurytemora carolleeae TaxID=1294199 RepID=UPI000C768E57|nr:uncharacterized protein LOC111702043 isoform X2 [Eurytemora carolleeae]|eukprot:XP_023329336.1 uncharacterized protein LOC111702043 isoform X2 [Eurytemora affinis]